MSDTLTPANPERNLLDEIEELNVLEAEELQEGVAFHAFRFNEASPLHLLDVILTAHAEPLVNQLNLPQGATLMTVQGNRMRIAYDPSAVSSQALQKQISGSLGNNVASVKIDETTKFSLPTLANVKG